MNAEKFNKIVEEFLEKTKATLIKKEDEYSLCEDRFAFFKREAQIAGVTPEKALYFCMLKHITSFIDMINTGDKYSQELWFDKLGDIVNYCILLYGLLEDDDMFAATKKAARVSLREGAEK